MAEVGIAAGAIDFGPNHAMGEILLRRDRSRGNAIPKTWPTSAGVEFGL